MRYKYTAKVEGKMFSNCVKTCNIAEDKMLYVNNQYENKVKNIYKFCNECVIKLDMINVVKKTWIFYDKEW